MAENQDFRTLPHMMEERTVVTKVSHGREFVFTHSAMKDVTKRPDKRGVRMESLDALCRFGHSYGSPGESSVFYNERSVMLYLNEQWRENMAELSIELSKALRRWINCRGEMNAIFSQEQLIDHIECWSDDIALISAAEGQPTVSVQSVLIAIVDLSLKASITYDRKYQDRNNQKLTFQISEENGAGAENKTIHRNWTLKIPVIEGGAPIDVQVRLAYHVPRNNNEQPYFFFECPKLDFYKEQAIEEVYKQLSVGLPGWNIFKGTPST